MTTYTKKFKEFIPEWNPESDDYIVGYRNLDDSEIRIPLLAVDNSITANKYIRKDIDDYANGIIRFNKGFTVSNKVMSTIYLQGLDGWMGTQKGDFEMNSLILREFLEVPELRKNKITVMGNQFWFTDSAMVKVANATGSDNYDIYFKLEDEEYAPFELNDIIKGIYHYDNGFWTVYLKVYELIVNPDTGGEIGVKAHSMNGRDPRQSMLLARMNNSDNPERQGSIFADGLRKYIRVLDGYNPDDPTSEGSIKTLKVQIGDLSTITNHPIFGDLEGYGLYADNVYLTGKLIVKNDPNQPGQELGVYRGVWNNQANYYKYDQVTYKGSLFTSKQIDNIGHIPTGSVDDLWWELTVAKGEDGTSAESNVIIELTNDNHNIPTDSEGKNPSYGGAYCTAYVFQGTNDVTDLYTISATVEAPVTSQQLQIVQNDNTVTITHISDDIDAAAIKFTATAVGYPTVTRTWNVAKVKSGIPGEPATAYWIVTDSPVIKKYVFNVNDSEVIRYEPSPFVVRAFAQTGQENIKQFDGYFRIKYGTQVNIVAGSVYQFTPQADVDNYTIEFFLEQGLYTLLDKEIITVVEDGRDGDTPDWNIFIFKKGPEQPSAPTFTTPPSSYPSDGWYDYPTSDGIWWMSTAVVNGNSKTIASWSVPIKTTGEDGLNGADGVDGADGKSIMWKGTFTSHPSNPENGWAYYNSIDKKSYVYQSGSWYQMTVDGVDGANGPQGVPGEPGEDGITYYTWIRYADTVTGEGISNDPIGKLFIGFAYNKTTPIESNVPGDYKWSRYHGEDGTDGIPGTPGADGKTYYTWIAYSDNSDGSGMYQVPTSSTKYIGIAVNKLTPIESSNPADYTWSKFKGEDGLAIIWKGDLKDPPANPQLNWVYRDTDNGIVYIWNGTAWTLMVADGSDGTNGTNGTNGLSVFITYHDNNIYNKPATPTGNGTVAGWHTTPTSSCVWMSQKVSSTATSGTWGAPIQLRGENGGYVDFKYAVSTSHNTPPSIVKTNRQPAGWSDVPPTVTSGLFLWMVNAFINPDNTLNGVWSDPMRISGETGPEGPRGPQGLHGNDGLQGPSIAFGGNWSDTTQYYGYADTQTCVYYGGKYYYTKTVSPDLSPLTIPSGATNNPASANGKVYWNEFVGQFDNIATGLLLAERIATSELTANKLFIVDRQESTGNIIAADGSIITKEEEKNLDPNQIIGRLTKGWYLDQGVIRSIAVNSDNTPKLILDKDGKITATGVNVTGTVHFENGTIGSLQVFNDSAWTATVNGPYPASSGFYYLRKNQGVTVTPQGHIIGKDYFLTGDSTVGPSVFIGDVYVPGSSVPGTDDSTLTSFLKLFNSLFERVLVNSQYHIKAKLPLFSVGEITAYGDDNMDIPSIWDGIPVDKVTIDLVNGKLTVIGGTGGIKGISLPSMTAEDALVGASLNAAGDVITFTKGTFATKAYVTWGNITNKPSTFAPSSHTHIISNITGLQTELDGKAPTTHYHDYTSIVKLGSTIYTVSNNIISLPSYPTTLPASDVYAWAKLSTLSAAINNQLTTGTSTPTDTDYYISQYAGGGTTTVTYHRRTHSALFTYIQGKLPSWSTSASKPSYSWSEIGSKPSTFAPSSHTHNYASTVIVGSTSYNINGNTISLPAYPTVPSALKNPNALTISLNGTSQGAYDGSAAKSINITAASVGAAASSHSHNYLPLSGGTLTGGIEIQNTLSGASYAYGGGGYSPYYNNIILRGNSSAGSSGILFTSSKGTTSINQTTDRAFIQYHPYGVTLSAEGTLPTIGTTGESGKLVIGVGNDADDMVYIQAPSTTGIKHIVGTSIYTIWDSGNFTNLNQLTTRNFSDLQNKPTTLDGYNITASDILTKIKTVDGAGSGLDADLLDGVHYDDIAYGKYLGYGGTSYCFFIPFYRYDAASDGSVVIGTFTTGKDTGKTGVGANASNVIEVFSKNQIWQTGSNDDRNYILLKSVSGGGQESNIYFATAMYNGQLWYGLRIYSFQDYGIYFKGYSTNTLTAIAYYKNYGGESILNSEIYNSITKVNPTNSISSPYYNYTKLALITDNVESATKLKTPRTLWGQSFNGSGNVSGALSGATTGSFSGSLSSVGLTVTNTGTSRATITQMSIGDVPTDFILGSNNANKWSITCRDSSASYSLGIHNYGRGAWDIFIAGSTGNVNIGTSTDSGYKLYVNGSAGIGTHLRVDSYISAGEDADDIYGWINVTRTASIENASYFSMVRAGNVARGFGIATDNSIIIGSAANNRTISDIYLKLSNQQVTTTKAFSSSNRIFTGFDSGQANSMSCSNWFRSGGATGWYNATYGGGIYQNDSTYVKIYGNKAFKVTSTASDSINTDGGIKASGSITAAGEVTAYSDIRLKSNIDILPYRGRLSPKTYIKDGKQSIGFIAQEVQELYPELVLVGEDENHYLSLNYCSITSVLSAQVNTIEDEVTILKNKIRSLEYEITILKNK